MEVSTRYWVALFNEGGESAGVERELARCWRLDEARSKYKQSAATYPSRLVMLCDRATVLARTEADHTLIYAKPDRTTYTAQERRANVYIEPRPKGRTANHFIQEAEELLFAKFAQVSLAGFAVLVLEPFRGGGLNLVLAMTTGPAPHNSPDGPRRLRRNPAYRLRRVSSFWHCNIDHVRSTNRSDDGSLVGHGALDTKSDRCRPSAVFMALCTKSLLRR